MKSITLLASFAILITSTLAQGGPIIPCTSTLTRLVSLNGSPISTTYLTTVTSTSSVDCGGCGAVTVTTIGGHGPVAPSPTATLIEGRTTSTTFVCKPTYAPKRA